jgi:hypothetical protein
LVGDEFKAEYALLKTPCNLRQPSSRDHDIGIQRLDRLDVAVGCQSPITIRAERFARIDDAMKSVAPPCVVNS